MTDKPLVILAVSGGVDSVVMLDLVSRAPGRYIVAHVDHGIRPESAEDAAFVEQLAQTYKFPYVSTRLSLGSTASEESARAARYSWLDKVRSEHHAAAIATAHHADDVIETMIINIARGTGWRGISSLRETDARRRPLLSWSKADIIAYAQEHELDWREDSTNQSEQYLRNRVRLHIMPRLSTEQRQMMLALNHSQLVLREQIEAESNALLNLYTDGDELYRYPLLMADEQAAIELIRVWMGESLELRRFRDLLLFVKTARTGTKWQIDACRYVLAKKSSIIVLSSRG